MHISAPPKITRPVNLSIEVPENENLEIPCSAVGNPKPRILWSLWSVKDQHTDPTHFTEEDDTLKFFNIPADMAGKYVCEAVNKIGQDTIVIDVKVLGKY